MGVPKFYRWLSERYPKINQVITDSALLPEFDHLYLDMNGIIHGCTHPSHLEVSDVLSERDMMLGIMHYLDRIITQIVKPKVSVFMAIDGVAPRAKLNQQRSRRFRSAKDMAEATKDLNRASVHVFDSNCITPGTEFMAKVSVHIQYFIRKKIKEDPLWKSLKVIFSGHDIPGEGEHKIMQHIREMKAQPGYKPNTRHVMYGQDADLIMLGLVSHEPHFTLLREVVNFGFGGDSKNTLKTVLRFTKQSDFQLLHLSVLREYLQIEFVEEDESKFDTERCIDDFVFLTFLVGNDFLPHMSTLDIGDGAFDLLFRVYKEERLKWGAGKYLTYCGEICDAQRLEDFLTVVGSVETEICLQREEDEAAYVKKKRRWNRRDGLPEGPTDADLKASEALLQEDFVGMMEDLMRNHSPQEFVSGWTPVPAGEKDYKGRYYFEKLSLTPIMVKEHKRLRQSYIEGLMWCLAYYYKGCISWGWFFPYHYGPMLSDLTDLPALFSNIHFELGAPLLPFEQLMGCLPPASAALVPKPYRFLMTSPQSPIIKFYPESFEVDMNGKKNPWEGVNILPFIDVNLLKETIANLCPPSSLSADERRRNSQGKVYLYTFDMTATETIPSPNRKIGLADIETCHSRVGIFEEPERTDICFMPKLVPGTQIPYPGFPSLNVLPIRHKELVSVGLNCFGSASKYLTMVLTLHEMPRLPPIEQLAENILGRSLYINWPMMHEARAVAITDATTEVRLVNKLKTVRKFTAKQQQEWQNDTEDILQKYLVGNGVPGAGGMQIGNVQYRLRLLPLQGMRTNPSNGSTKKVFGTEEADVPLQLALWQAPAPDPRFEERGPLSVHDRFPDNARVVLTKGKYRGCEGLVVGAVDDNKIGVKVQVLQPEPPFGLAIARSVQESYITMMDASKLVKLHPNIFGKIMGALFFEPGRYDIGLNLKYAEGLCIVGYTRKKPSEEPKTVKKDHEAKKAWAAGDSLLVVGSKRAEADENTDSERIQWEYTPKAIRLVSIYRQKFPQVFAALAKKPNERKYDATELFGAKGPELLSEIREWLNSIETAKMPRTPVSTEAMPTEAIQAVQKAADVRTAASKKADPPTESLVKIPASALYRESSTSATDILQASDWNNNEAPELGDRVVNLCANGVPFGARGTVVGIHDPASGCVEVVMDEEFIGGGNLQGACSNFRGKLAVWAHLLKVSPPNSKELVDKLVPKGSGKAAVERIINTIEKQAKGNQKDKKKEPTWGGAGVATAKTESAKASPNPAADALPAQVPSTAPTSAGAKPTKTTPRPSSRHADTSTGRAMSSSRGKQGTWREARGPDEKGIGFRGANGRKGPKSGLQKWKNMTRQSTSVSASKSADLKALLGVGSASAAAPPAAPPADASAGLKALLGVQTSVGSSAPPVPPPQHQLHHPGPPPVGSPQVQLGVPPTHPGVPVGYPTPVMPHPSMAMGFAPPAPAPPAILTAADKLFQLMRSGGPVISNPMMGPSMPSQTPPPSSFNFSYVEEGKEATAAPQHPNMYQTTPSQPMMVMQPIIGMRMQPLPPPRFDLPEDEYPTLGADPKINDKETKKETKAEDAPPKKEVKAPQPIVPSVVVSHARK